MMRTRVRLTAAEPVDLGYGAVLPAGTHDGLKEVSGQQISSNYKMTRYFIRINNADIDVSKFIKSGEISTAE